MFAGKRLLIVEDEFFVARELEAFVEERGGKVVAMTGRLDEAMEAVDLELHGALVDVQLGPERSYPVIDKLKEAGVPVILMTGYNRRTLREDLRDGPIMPKPFQEQELERLAARVFGD